MNIYHVWGRGRVWGGEKGKEKGRGRLIEKFIYFLGIMEFLY